MRYISTRGGAPSAGFADILLEGLAPDGGLYVPESWPAFDRDALAGFAGAPYAQVAAEVFARFAGDDFAGELEAVCATAYATFRHRAVTPLQQLGEASWLLDLSGGPTLAFKDVAMQALAGLYGRELARRGRKLTIVVATSGDTGGAAVEAFRGSAHVDLVVLFPEGKISEVQRRFMTTTEDDNIRCVAVEGAFDDCQAIVKALFADGAFRTDVDLSGVNSINWARIVAQSVYYVTSAVALGAPDRAVNYAVPTGNFGDAFAGWVARRMGVPIARLIVATNGNDIVARALQTGRYARGTVQETQSPAMDIQVASNFERLYFDAVGRDAADTAEAFGAFAREGALTVPTQARQAFDDLFRGVAVSEAETTATIARVEREIGIVIDPHTAVGVAAAQAAAGPVVVLSTAHPAKFPDAVRAAIGREPDVHDVAQSLATKVERIDQLPADVEAVKTYVRAFSRR